MQVADFDAVLAIAAAAPEAPHWQPEAYRAYLPEVTEPPVFRTVVVAEGDGRIVGFAAATLVRDGAQNLCQLDSIAVMPAARRQGLGLELLRCLLAWAEEAGANRFSLEVRASNAAAIALYERFGLLEEGRRARYYADPEEDALLLGRAITVGLPTGGFPP